MTAVVDARNGHRTDRFRPLGAGFDDNPPVPPAATRSAALLRCLLLGAAAVAAFAADAQDRAAGGAAPPGEGAGGFAYRVVVEAPSPLKETLLRDVGIARWQGYADMTAELLGRLAREAVDEVRNAAAAEGYFSATTTVDIDRKSTPAVVTLKVVMGEPTKIDKVDIRVTGPATTDVPLGTDAIAKLTRDWALPQGTVFRQPAWTAAKDQAVATLQGSPYAAAKIEKSEAYIDPDARRADLDVEIASGPRFTFGKLDITGLQKYSPSLVENFSTFDVGEPYSERLLDRFLRRLNSSGYEVSPNCKLRRRLNW